MMSSSRNLTAGMQLQSHHRGQRFFTVGLSSKDVSDENQLDLFSKTRRTLSIASSDDSSDGVSVKLGRVSVGSAKLTRSGIDDLLSSNEGGKHDYDWLLTPPGTPLIPLSDGSESQPVQVAPRSSSLARSVSTTKASRLLVSESNHSTRPARSSSVTRTSVSSSQRSTYTSNRGPSILNTSSASVSSYTRPASPSTRAASRPSTPSSRSTTSRSSTPSRNRPSPTNFSVDRTRPIQNSRPSAPSSRPQIPANLNSTASQSNSRPLTPTRQNPVSSITPAVSPSTSVGRVMSNGRTSGPASRTNSPSPRVRPPQQPVVPPDFPLDTLSNLRTTLPPDRSVSAGRSRPVSVTVKGNPEAAGSANMPRRHSSPIVSRGRLIDSPGKNHTLANGHAEMPNSQRHVSELLMRKPAKPSTIIPESTEFGRTISKKSLDMAIRHMDIRNGSGSIRQLSGTTLFPQSIRSATSKTHSAQALESVNMNGGLQNGGISERGNSISRSGENGNGSGANVGRYSTKLSDVGIYESTRYDALLFKEDLKNTNWLHSIDDKSDQGLIFDNGFDPLPEPFSLL
ncbi:integrator complex subunit 6 homolog [Mangifera indica]|uniref:integrator complex subunit 6 homolog n=1 Tax=Mangifera indica TaxID=29780 RepID=UPI001CF9C64A|nr:integrator complex subunit 6 homolog [Mangifera indica]XP_044491090.1 integrator complex subunit 6 homolog [Mangifera indica]